MDIKQDGFFVELMKEVVRRTRFIVERYDVDLEFVLETVKASLEKG